MQRHLLLESSYQKNLRPKIYPINYCELLICRFVKNSISILAYDYQK